LNGMNKSQVDHMIQATDVENSSLNSILGSQEITSTRDLRREIVTDDPADLRSPIWMCRGYL
jgi:hypothetical protein